MVNQVERFHRAPYPKFRRRVASCLAERFQEATGEHFDAPAVQGWLWPSFSTSQE
jgi:hypothetical protein